MRVLLDTNVILDALLQRPPWQSDADAVWQAHRVGLLTGCVTASALTDIYYISRRLVGGAAARQAVRVCLDELTILPVGRADVEQAYALPLPDLEDALQVACAVREQLDAIVTRDPNGFPGAPLPIWSPTDLIARLSPPTGPAASGPQTPP